MKFFSGKISFFQLFVLFLTLLNVNAVAQADLCSGATSLPVNTTCVTTPYNVTSAFGLEAAVPTCGSVGAARDGWFTFTTGAGTTQVTITATTNRNLVLVLYSGTCASLTQVACTDAGTGGVTETITNAVAPNTTYFIRLIRKNVSANNMIGDICVQEPATPPSNDQCASSILTTCGGTYTGSTALATATGDPTTTCTTTAGTPGVWYRFVGTGFITTASLCGSGYDTKIQVYSGTCASMACVIGNDDYCGLQSQVTWTAALGTTYYIFVGGYAGATGNYSLAITCDIPTAPGCATPTAPATASVLSCATTNLTWTAPATGGTPTQYLLNFGTNNPPTNINNNTNLGNVLTYTPPSLLPNTTYYWQILPQNGAGTASGCSIFSFTTGPANVPNDLCGGAIPLTSGVTINDDNSCASDEAPMAAGSCWSGGTVNSLWYSINVTGTTLGVLTTGGSLANTQIAVYSGPCSSSMTQVGCNDNAPAAGCSGGTTVNSQLNLTGLTAGTYYIRVDGRSNAVGTYSIVASTSGSVGTAVAVPGQDCTSPSAVCANPMPVGNPGYSGAGNICDFSSGTCVTSGELNSLWFQININATGNLNFNIIPNDYTGCDTETDYDFALWRISGTGATTSCATIATTGATALVACNYDVAGVTGLSPTGNQPTTGITPAPSAGCYDLSYQPQVAVTNGDVYYLVVQNYSGSTSGFTITFPTGGTNAGVNTGTPAQVIWSGGANTTAWTTAQNWGSCTTPSCSPPVDAVVAPASASQPVISTNQTVKSVTINSGATLTINAGITLNVCGDFTNNGTLICNAGSTVNFNGTGTQNVSGNLTGTNKFANFTVNKTSGTVNLLNSIEAGGNLTTSSATSIINTNGVDILLGGNFVNHSGSTTFSGINSTTSTFTFNGTAAQTYSPNNNSATPALSLNNVVMNHSGTGVSISTTNTPNMIIGTSGTLTLTNGRIITPGTQQVEVQNTATTAVNTGNTASFVEGNLRRYLAAGATGSFEFPVGHATKGYQRVNLTFTTAASGSASQLLARFDAWGGTFAQPGAPGWGPECAATYNQPFLDNGYWSIDLASGSSTGTYDITLYNTNYTNAAVGFSVGKSISASPSWNVLSGTCVAACPVTAVRRNSMSGFSKFATIQSSVVLPLQLAGFSGSSKGTYNELKWETASEESLGHFELQSSENGEQFKSIHSREAKGAPGQYTTYSYNDHNYFFPITYYRLKSVDSDGSLHYSSILSVENRKETLSVLSVFPNPASGEVNINFEAPYESEMKVEVIDIVGRLVFSGAYPVKEGKQMLPVTTLGLSDGTYILSCRFENQPVVNTRLVINK